MDPPRTCSRTPSVAAFVLLMLMSLAAPRSSGAASTLQLGAAAFLVRESDGSITIPVTRDGASAGVMTVDFTTSDSTGANSAISGSDFSAASGTLIFAQGESVKTFTVTLINDGLIEGTEVFSVGLSNPTGGATLGTPSQASVSISDTNGGVAVSGSSGGSGCSFKIGSAVDPTLPALGVLAWVRRRTAPSA